MGGLTSGDAAGVGNVFFIIVRIVCSFVSLAVMIILKPKHHEFQWLFYWFYAFFYNLSTASFTVLTPITSKSGIVFIFLEFESGIITLLNPNFFASLIL